MTEKRNQREKYWFTAKRYGWGWGLPSSWQGWIVLASYVAVVSYLALRCNPIFNPIGFTLSILVPSAALLLIAWLKGEPPRWRWGDTREEEEEPPE